MPRPVWSGSIMFGLVNIPVKLYSIEKQVDLHFNLIDSRNRSKVRYQRVNEATGEEVPWDQIVKGYEYEDDQFVLLDDEDFAQAAVEATKTIEVQSFVNLDDIPYTYFEKPYMLVPGKRGEKPYVLLREALKETCKVGIAKVVIRTRQYLSALIAEEDALILDVMRFAQELRKPDEFELPRGEMKEYNITAKELDFAEKLVNAMAGEWKPEQYKDEYREALMDWINKKIKVGETGPTTAVEEPEEEEEGEPVDIMALLQQSLKDVR